jgi:YgiT-type zinc finger domain-containing protein
MLKVTSCPNCGSDKIKKVKHRWTDQFHGQIYTVPDLEFYECPNCEEQFFDRTAMRKIEAHSPAFAKKRAVKQAV